MRYLSFFFILIIFLSGCAVSEKTGCVEKDWNCICAKANSENDCINYLDCVWTNFHSDEFYCREMFCMDYEKAECGLYDRCIWLLDKNGQNEYCEEKEYFDPERHELLNKSN